MLVEVERHTLRKIVSIIIFGEPRERRINKEVVLEYIICMFTDRWMDR